MLKNYHIFTAMNMNDGYKGFHQTLASWSNLVSLKISCKASNWI